MRDPAQPKTTRERVLDLLVPLGSPAQAWLHDLLLWLDDAIGARELGFMPAAPYRERMLELMGWRHHSEPVEMRLAVALVHVEMLEAELAAAREPAELVAAEPADAVSAWLARQDDEVTLEHEAGCLHDAWSHDGERWDDLDDAEREPFRAVAREARRMHGAAAKRELVADPPPADDDDSVDVWHVTRAGAESFVSGYDDGQRGLVALHFAADDIPGWAGDSYDERVAVRRCRPIPESEPGQTFRVLVKRGEPQP